MVAKGGVVELGDEEILSGTHRVRKISLVDNGQLVFGSNNIIYTNANSSSQYAIAFGQVPLGGTLHYDFPSEGLELTDIYGLSVATGVRVVIWFVQ